VAAASASRAGLPVETEGFVPPMGRVLRATLHGTAGRLRVDLTSPFSSAVLLDDLVVSSVGWGRCGPERGGLFERRPGC
jgi:hypothetical protein